MKALWFEAGRMELREMEPVSAKPGEALIDVVAVGICNTDLELARGYMDFTGVPGHEFVGKVVFGPRELEGRMVVGEINIGCGCCEFCMRNQARHCPNREVLGIFKRQGAFAQQIALPVANLHPLPDSVDATVGVFVEPLAAALRIPEQIRIAPGVRMLLVGDGKLAQLIARIMALYGVRLTVIGRHIKKLALISPFAENTLLEKDFTDRECFSIAVEASGKPTGLITAKRALQPMGILVLKSTYAGNPEMDLSSFVVDELTLMGSRCGPFAPAIDLLKRNLVDPRPLVSAIYDFGDAAEAFQAASDRESLKIVVRME